MSSGLLFRVAASLAIAVQRGNFDVLAAAAPALSSSSGRLGAPLGEEPEVWRAAPAAAVVVADDVVSSAVVGGLPAARLSPAPALPVRRLELVA